MSILACRQNVKFAEIKKQRNIKINFFSLRLNAFLWLCCTRGRKDFLQMQMSSARKKHKHKHLLEVVVQTHFGALTH